MVRHRLRLLMLLVAAPYLVALVRLWFVQGRLASRIEYLSVARDTTTRREVIPAPRGRILDRRGIVLAENIRRFDICFNLKDLDPAPRRPLLEQICDALVPHQAAVATPDELDALLFRRVDWRVELAARPWHPDEPVALEEVEVPAGAARRLEALFRSVPWRHRPFELRSETSGEREVHTILFRPRRAFRRELAILHLAAVLGDGFSVRRVKEVFDEKEGSQREELLAADVSLDAVAAIEYHPERFPGITIRAGSRRRYPIAEPMGTVLGYLQKVQDPSRLAAEGRLLEQANIFGPSHFAAVREGLLSGEDPVGAAGLEAQYETCLRGLYGMRWYPLDPLSQRAGEDFVRVMEVPGEDIAVQLDAELQTLIHDRLAAHCGGPFPGAEAGSAVVMEISTGAILASASYPSFDPNRIREVGYREERNRLLRDPRDPEPDPAKRRVIPWEIHRPLVQSIYPGSVFKLVTAIAALEGGGAQGRFDPRRTFVCEGRYKDYPYWCHLRHGHGSLDLREALERSCNSYFYHLAEEIIAPAELGGLHDWGLALGYGSHPGIDLPPAPGSTAGSGFEARGVLTDPRSRPWVSGGGALASQLGPLPWWAPSLAAFAPPAAEVQLSQLSLALAAHHAIQPPSTTYARRDQSLRRQLNRRTICQYAIGQVFVEASPLQVLLSSAIVALRGSRVPRPFLVEPSEPAPFVPPLRDGRSAVRDSTWNVIRDGMRDAARRGTAAKSGLESLDIAAKTGTAQFRDRGAENLYHAWITGFAPVSAPRYAFVVCLEKSPDGGGAACAPILVEILRYLARDCPELDPSGSLARGGIAEGDGR
ncbi:MAG: hypothetical protein JXA90_13290 [Planctomycetes bacterium]|nr:hypothetical protein [Planctomycetota bacterium]